MTVYRAQDFAASIGVNTHIPYTDGGYGNIDKVLGCLSYLGIQQIRDWILPYPTEQGYGAYFTALGSGLVKINYIQRGKDPPMVIDRVVAMEEKYPGTTTGIEGVNEPNNQPKFPYGGKFGIEAAKLYQLELYRLAKANPVTAPIPVVYFSDLLTPPANSCDFYNTHPYSKGGAQPAGAIKAGLVLNTGKLPALITEAGFFTVPTRLGWSGVDEYTQAIYTLNTYLDAFALGIKRTYLYQLLDAYPDPAQKDQERHFGLFDVSYHPKPAAVALRALMTELRDPLPKARNFTPASIIAGITGLPATAQALELQRSDGTTLIVLWDEQPIWNGTTSAALDAVTSAVEIKFARRAWRVETMALPLSIGFSRVGENTGNERIQLGAEPLMIRVSG